jgi:hypothetical protein
MKTQPFSPAQATALRTRFEHCKEQILALDWLSEGSVTENHPGNWRWTRKVKAKTVTVALSPAQAEAFRTAIANHRQLEKLTREMRSLSQAFLLQSIQGPTRRRPPTSVPNPP